MQLLKAHLSHRLPEYFWTKEQDISETGSTPATSASLSHTHAGTCTHLPKVVLMCWLQIYWKFYFVCPWQNSFLPSYFTHIWANAVIRALLSCDTISLRSQIFPCLHFAFMTSFYPELQIYIPYNRLMLCSFYKNCFPRGMGFIGPCAMWTVSSPLQLLSEELPSQILLPLLSYPHTQQLWLSAF